METKNDKYVKLIHTTFKLIGSLGYENVTITLLSKHSGVSRGWIYKYIDSDIEGVLKFCLKEYGQEFARFGDIQVYNNPKDFSESILTFTAALADKIVEDPSSILIYFSNYNSDNLVGETVRELDGKYLNILTENIEKSFEIPRELASDRARAFHLMRMGGLHSFAGFAGSKEEFEKRKVQFLNLLSACLKQLGQSA